MRGIPESKYQKKKYDGIFEDITWGKYGGIKCANALLKTKCHRGNSGDVFSDAQNKLRIPTEYIESGFCRTPTPEAETIIHGGNLSNARRRNGKREYTSQT